MLQDDDQQEQAESSQSSLPSIRQLFGIKTSDNLDALISPPQRPHRANNPPPSAFPHQAVNAVNTSPRPSLERRLDTRTPVRSASFSSGQTLPSPPQVGQHSSTTARGRLMSPRSASSSSVSPYASLPQQTTSRSPTFSRSRHSPSTHTSTDALPPISTAIPGFIPANRGRAASDTETFTRGGGLAAGRIITLSSQQQQAPPRESAPLHPSLHPRNSADSAAIIDQRGHVGRSPVQATSDAHFASSGRSHAHSISSSAHSDEPAPSHAAWTDRSRSSIEYSQTSESHEYAPHPYSSASISARQKTGYPPIPITSTSAPTGSNYTSEGSTQASPSRGGVERHVPPSSFPHYGVYSSANRPKSGNSSEGDESKGGFGKYECEYCSKRFNRPSSLRIHINTHTGAKPFQCPFPSCGRRFSVMSNMRRHARTHGNMLSPSAGEDPHSHPRGSGDSAQGSTSVSLNGHHHDHHHVGRRRSSFVDVIGKSIKPDVDVEMDVDELEGDDEDDMDYDGGAGSSESESYHRGHHPERPSSSDQSHNFHGY